MLDFNTVLIMMNSGSLYKYGVREQKFHLVFSDSNFKSYSVVCPSRKKYLCAVGNIKGTIRIVDAKDSEDITIKDISLFDGKVLSLVWVNDAHLLCSGPDGQCLLLRISYGDYSEGEDKNYSLKTLLSLNLPACRHRWITGACCVCSTTGSELKSYLVCGDKNGSVFLYPFVEEECLDAASLMSTKPLQSFFRIHGKTGVTSVCERGGSIFTTGRDGFYREWKVQQGVLVQLNGYKVLKGLDWIDRLNWSNNDFQVYGFFSTHFVVWSVSHNQQLISIHCGGGHRSWGFWRQDDVSRFVYLKNGEACVVDCGSHTKQSLLHPALHGREICNVKFVPLHGDNVSPVLCSASEDTFITVSAFINKESSIQWKPLAVLKGHLSSVRTLAVCYSGPKTAQYIDRTGNPFETACILFSGGGRAEVRAWNLNVLNTAERNALNVPSERKLHLEQEFIKNNLSCQHEHLCTYFLGESRHKKKYNSWKTRKLKLDPETRVMTIHASPLPELIVLDESCGTNIMQDFASSPSKSLDINHPSQQYILSIAGSDGYLRILSFNERTRNFQTLAATYYHKCCVLKTLHYIHRTKQSQRFSFTMSASTRGDIAIWNLSDIVSKHLMKGSEKDVLKVHGKDADHEDEDKDYVDFLKPNTIDQLAMESGAEEDLQPVLCLKAHQSGINSLHALQTSESTALVASGGDDNSITVHNLLISDSQVTSLTKGTKVDAHSAQITGIWLVSPSLMVSTSIDQRVTIWQLTYQHDLVKVDRITCKYIDISDVSCMDVFIERNSVRLCVAGEGMCLLGFDLDNL